MRWGKPGHDELRGKAKFHGLPFKSNSEKKFRCDRLKDAGLTSSFSVIGGERGSAVGDAFLIIFVR